jgi:hypothetical protein
MVEIAKMPTQNVNHELELSILFISVSLEVLAYVEKFNRQNSFRGAGSPIKSVFESGAQISHASGIKLHFPTIGSGGGVKVPRCAFISIPNCLFHLERQRRRQHWITLEPTQSPGAEQ